jgi:hypothetical protein
MIIRANCPQCGYEIDDATGVGEAHGDRPEPGHIAICIQCAGLGIYIAQEDGTLGLRQPTVEEAVDLADDDEVIKVQAAILGREIWGSRG